MRKYPFILLASLLLAQPVAAQVDDSPTVGDDGAVNPDPMVNEDDIASPSDDELVPGADTGLDTGPLDEGSLDASPDTTPSGDLPDYQLDGDNIGEPPEETIPGDPSSIEPSEGNELDPVNPFGDDQQDADGY